MKIVKNTLLVLACARVCVGAAAPVPPVWTAPSGESYRLVWHDEFEGSAIDASKWDSPIQFRQKASLWHPSNVYYRDVPAGVLEKGRDGYLFRYHDAYLAQSDMPDISATLPKSRTDYRSKVLFPFFSGLLAEGPQKERQCRELHIDERDLFTRLVETSAYGAIGAVHVAP